MIHKDSTSFKAPRQPWELSEDLILKELAAGSKMPVKDMAPILGRTIPAIRTRLKHLGIVNDYNPRRYTKNESFFETPNPINSYFAGILSADGSVCWKDSCVRWSLERGDLSALETLKSLSKYTGPIGYREKRGLGKDLSCQHYIDIYGAKKWNEDLHRNFGLLPAKAHRIAPPNTVNDLLNACYILGYIDGDGSLSFTESGGWTISITSATERILEFIMAFCNRHFHGILNTSSKVCHYENHYVYSIKGYRAIQLFDFLRALPCPKFSRKWENPEILRVIAARKAKQPDLFKCGNVLSFDSTGTIVRHTDATFLPPNILPFPAAAEAPAKAVA